MVLRTSKTHNRNQKPQIITVASIAQKDGEFLYFLDDHNFCPYVIITNYIKLRNSLRIKNSSKHPNCFIFSNGSPVKVERVRAVLKRAVADANLDPENYDTHSLRSGRARDLFKVGISVEDIKKIGRWNSNAVYNCLK